jgi:hypothetical protein
MVRGSVATGDVHKAVSALGKFDERKSTRAGATPATSSRIKSAADQTPTPFGSLPGLKANPPKKRKKKKKKEKQVERKVSV